MTMWCVCSGGGGYEVVVAIEMDTDGEVFEWRTRFTSCIGSASHKSTLRMKC